MTHPSDIGPQTAFDDARLERDIKRQTAALNQAMAFGGAGQAMAELDTLKALLAKRSPQQVARMEKVKGLSRA